MIHNIAIWVCYQLIFVPCHTTLLTLNHSILAGDHIWLCWPQSLRSTLGRMSALVHCGGPGILIAPPQWDLDPAGVQHFIALLDQGPLLRIQSLSPHDEVTEILHQLIPLSFLVALHFRKLVVMQILATSPAGILC